MALPAIPETDDEKTSLIDTLQEWKTQKYQDMIGEILTLYSIKSSDSGSSI